MTDFIEVQPLLNPKAREWCKMPYPGHPNGCPNIGKKAECPPQAPMFQDYFDMSGPFWMGIEKFDLGEHARRMKELHPDWTDRQARCCLYWQNGVRKRLRDETDKFVSVLPSASYWVSTMVPEAMGVNVIATALRSGIPIKARPNDIIYKISIVGRRKL